MRSLANDFVYSDGPEPHRERTKKLLQSHPEVRALIGRNPFSAVLVLLFVGLQLLIAFFLRDQPWWAALLAAYVIGAFANHALFVLIHECAHNLVFRSRIGNILLGIVADLSGFVPSSVSFRHYHLNHHSHQGDYDFDADLANRWEARLIGHSFLGKAFWLLFFPVFQALRPLRLRGIKFVDGWTAANWVIVFGVDILLFVAWGPVSLLYLVASLFFAIGLHPLGARWIQEHYLTFPPQETYSYYGKVNILALNVGFHNEHHDVPSVPWNNLPKLKKIAPEMYDTLVSHTSYVKLLWRFLTDADISLYSRIVRKGQGEPAVQTEP